MSKQRQPFKARAVMPPKHNRILYVVPDDILAEIIYWGIQQSPFDYPDNIPEILPKLTGMLKLKFITMGIKETGGIRLWKITYKNLRSYLVELVLKMKELQDWNISKIDRDKGIGIDDQRTRFIGKDPDERTPPEYDFIDIHAVARNVANNIYIGNMFTHEDICFRPRLKKVKS